VPGRGVQAVHSIGRSVGGGTCLVGESRQSTALGGGLLVVRAW